MKTLRQKTLSLALFGLLAMNSGYSLLSQNENTYEGQVSFASVSTETIESRLTKILDSDSYDSDELSISKRSSGARTKYIIDGYKNLEEKDKKLFSKLLLDSNVEFSLNEKSGDAVLTYTHKEIKTNGKVKVDGKTTEIVSARIGNIQKGTHFFPWNLYLLCIIF